MLPNQLTPLPNRGNMRYGPSLFLSDVSRDFPPFSADPVLTLKIEGHVSRSTDLAT